MEEYIACWRVQIRYALTDIQRDTMVDALLSIPEAVVECSSWAECSPAYGLDFSNGRIMRIMGLLEFLQKSPFETGIRSVSIFTNVLRLTYEGEDSTMTGILGQDLTGDYFYRDFFYPLYMDSLLLKKAEVERYCDEFEYPAVQDVKGMISGSQKRVKTPPATPTSAGSKKDKDRIQATRQNCEMVRVEIEQGQHGFQVGDKYKTNWATFHAAVEAALGSKPHRDTAREEWGKVAGSHKHKGRVPEQ